jgi:hypothetical protein
MDRVRREADCVDSAYITDAELVDHLNASYGEVYDLLQTAYGEDYFFSVGSPFSTDGVKEQYDLPADFVKLLGVDYKVGQFWQSLKPFPMGERNKYQMVGQLGLVSYWQPLPYRYKLAGGKLWLAPLIPTGQTLRIIYSPRCPTYAAGDSVDDLNGWLELAVVDTVIKVKGKQEIDCSLEVNRKAGLMERIKRAASNRDLASPIPIVDSWNPNGGFFDGSY